MARTSRTSAREAHGLQPVGFTDCGFRVEASWYDYPQYYDLAFRSETRMEADFIEAACRKYCPLPARRLLEPACGTGRLIAQLAARGYEMTGFDLSQPALEYSRQRLARRGLRALVFRADMAAGGTPTSSLTGGTPTSSWACGGADCDMATKTWPCHPAWPCHPRVDAAYCLLDSFRHLLSERGARSHLECVARSLRPGGIYILGFHLLPPDAAEECTERWTERRGRTRVTVTLRVLSTDRRRRIETLRISMLVRSGKRVLHLRDQFPLRMYTAAQFRRLLRAVPDLELCDVYDFWYEIDHPLRLSDELSDTVFILRKRRG